MPCTSILRSTVGAHSHTTWKPNLPTNSCNCSLLVPSTNGLTPCPPTEMCSTSKLHLPCKCPEEGHNASKPCKSKGWLETSLLHVLAKGKAPNRQCKDRRPPCTWLNLALPRMQNPRFCGPCQTTLALHRPTQTIKRKLMPHPSRSRKANMPNCKGDHQALCAHNHCSRRLCSCCQGCSTTEHHMIHNTTASEALV